MKNKIKNLLLPILGFVTVCLASVFVATPTFAVVGVSVSPMNQQMTLTPGEKQCGSFAVSNGATYDEELSYKVTLEPFFVDENYNSIFEDVGLSQIVSWTTLSRTEGKLSPNEKNEITFCINTPSDAPAGGQYMAFRVTSTNSSESNEGVNLNVSYGVAHIVFAEVAGTTVRQGEITDMNVPGLLLSGNLSATSTVKNTGNVHGAAKYTLQVFPLFSDEEVYTNEESPDTKVILPNRSLVNINTWEETPPIGIFNVVYTVEFEGVTNQLKKMVIVCPIWLLVIIIAVIVLFLFYFISKAKKNKK